ncbi:hypothetical protein N7497_010013 [Penicillium chrysogenum]|nr:hypothetical protein N7497_010013 [Penicillium chrysogenum]
MTVFIASLFLPYTVDFHINNSRARSPSPTPPSANPTIEGITPIPNSAASLFEKGVPGKVPGLTPGATTDHERIFAAQIAEQEKDGYPFPLAAEQDNRLLTESEGHSPVWGATTSLNQPKPLAVLSPSPSILKHQDLRPTKEPVPHRPPAVETIASHARLRKASTASRKLSFSKAEWTIETAEQGNGGLRNAVRSAKDAGGLG